MENAGDVGPSRAKTIIVLCKYNDDNHLLTIEEGTKLMDIYKSLDSRWKGMNEMYTKLQYEIPTEQLSISLCSDEDVVQMVLVHIMFKMSICKMVAIDKSCPTPSSPTPSRRIEVVDDTERVEGGCSNGAHTPLVYTQAIRGNGQKFDNPDHFRTVLKSYCIANRRGFEFSKNNSEKIIVVCNKAGCHWRIYASFHKRDQSFAIRNCNLKHTCEEDNVKERGHPRADSCWVAAIIKEKVRNEPGYRPCSAVKDIQRDFGVAVPYHQAWLGKEIALREVHGNYCLSFNRLRRYCNVLKETNPGSVADLEVHEQSLNFRRIFVCISACLDGFLQGCRPLLFLDGTHITSKWKGCLLSAVAKDADGGMYTVAYAVVDVETNDNWEWFCRKLHTTILSQGEPIDWGTYTFFTDRHDGLCNAIPVVFPGSHHAFCLKHLVDNFKTQVLRKYPNMNSRFWCDKLKKAAYALTSEEFYEHLNDILTALPLSKDFIIRVP